MKTQINKKKLIPSLVFNLVIFTIVLICTIIIFAVQKSSAEALKYFTTLSNLIMGCVSGIYAIFVILLLKNKRTKIPKAMEVINFSATVLVTMTMLIVLFVLTPSCIIWQKDVWAILYEKVNMFFHIIVPVLAILTYILFEHSYNSFRFPECLYGLILIFIYGVVYTVLALTHIKNGEVMEGYDWYGFISMFKDKIGIPGATVVSIIITSCFGFVICWLLWLANRKINLFPINANNKNKKKYANKN